MWTRRSFVELLTAGALAPAAAPADSRADAPGQARSRRDEIDAFRAFAEATHPRGLAAAADPDWRKLWEVLRQQAEQLTDGAYFHRLRRALGWFRDGHTTVLPFEFVGGVPAALAGGPFRFSLPLRVRVCDDGAWVTAAGEDAASLLGSRLHGIGRRSVPELIREVADGWPGNDAWAHRWSAGMLASPAFLQALGAIDTPGEPIPFEAVAVGGEARRITVRPREDGKSQLVLATRQATPREQWARAAGRGNYLRSLDGGVLYVSLDDMDDVTGETFAALTREVLAALQPTGVRRLVIDLRRNGGGDNYLGEALRKGIGRSSVNRPGGLYVLIGPQTFSAAQNLANRLERETFATFVGEPTGGAPNHFGDSKIHSGAVTGLTAMVSSLPWFDSYPQDRRPWILPDLPVPETGVDWRAGRDAALAAALEHGTTAAPDDLSPDRVYYFSRASQQRSWNPFWRA